MAPLKICNIDKDIQFFLRDGGSYKSPLLKNLIDRIVVEIVKDTTSDIKYTILDSEMPPELLTIMYARVLQALKPYPAINVSGPLLVPTLLFMEPYRLKGLIDIGWNKTLEESYEYRIDYFINTAIELCTQIKTAHDTAYGPAKWVITGTSPSKAEENFKNAESGLKVLKFIFTVVVLFGVFLIFANSCNHIYRL